MDSSKQEISRPCVVCDAESIGINFGVRTCMACKAFFRRNAVKLGNYEFICPNDGDCPIIRTNRIKCKCCRLAKCFRVGMQKDLILSEFEKEERRQIIERNRQKKCEKKINLTTVDVIRPSRLLSQISNTSFCLSSYDNTILSNIFNTYESSCMTTKYSYSDFPSIVHSSLHTYLNEYSNSHQSLIVYFKRIPEFNKISIDDRVRLLRSQFGFINNINEPILHPGVSTKLIVSLSNIFGVYLANRLLECIERIQIFTYDSIIIKLLLIIVAFSSGNCRNRNDMDMDEICDDTLAIFSAQNIYVELLWKYILSRSSNEFNAVKFFDKLIQFLLYLLNVHLLVDGYINNLHNEIEQMEPLMQSMWPQSSNNEITLNE